MRKVYSPFSVGEALQQYNPLPWLKLLFVLSAMLCSFTISAQNKTTVTIPLYSGSGGTAPVTQTGNCVCSQGYTYIYSGQYAERTVANTLPAGAKVTGIKYTIYGTSCSNEPASVSLNGTTVGSFTLTSGCDCSDCYSGTFTVSGESVYNYTSNVIRIDGPDYALSRVEMEVTYTTIESIVPVTSLCAGSTFNVAFNNTTTGGVQAGNIYTAQLSDANGNFATPTTIGTVSSVALSGNISVTIPAGLAAGTNYRIRVNASTPSTIGAPNANSLSYAPIQISSQPVTVNKYPGENGTLSVTATGNGSLTYQWKKNGAIINGATAASLNFSSLSSSDAGSYTVDVTDACGTVTSAPALVVLKSVLIAGYLNGLKFDGTNDYVEIPSQPSNQFSSETEFTVSLWFKANSMATAGLFNRPSGGGGDMQFWLTAENGVFTYGIDKHGYGWTWIGTEKAYEVGEWVHITTVRRNVNGQRRMEIYANGKLVGSGTVNYTSSASGAPIRIGTHKDANSFFANGQIDNVSLWKKALTVEEIKSLAVTTLNGNEAGLAGFWRFNETSGTIAYDATPNANHGIIKDMGLSSAWSSLNAGEVITLKNEAYRGFLTARDESGNPLTYSVVTAPVNGTLTIGNAATGAFTYTPNANYIGPDMFSYRISNGADISNTATVNVTVVAPNKAPVPAVAELPTIQGECAVTVTAPTANDDNDGLITGTTTDPLSYQAQGNYTITWTYRDKEGLTSTQTQQVIVKDETKPVFAAVASINKNNDAGKCGAVVTYTMPTATDNCVPAPDPNAVYVLNSGDQLYDHVNKRLEVQQSPGLPITFVPTDGNKMAIFLVMGSTTARLSQNVSLPSAGPVELSFDLQYKNHYAVFDNSNQFMSVEIRNSATDALLKTVFKTEPGAAAAIPMTSFKFDISEFAGQNVKVVLTNTNIQSYFFDILLDNVKIPGSSLVNGSFETGDYTGWTITESGAGTWGIGSGKASPVTITQTTGLPSGSLFPVGKTTNTFTATDAAGNTSTISFDVTVTDTQKPTVITKNITVNLDASGNATITAADVDNGSTDNCAIPANGYSLDKTSFTCANLGTNTVTLTVTDAAGNSESKTAIVTVKDVTAPTAKAKDVTVQLDANGAATITPAMLDNGSSDECGNVTLALSKTTFGCADLGTQAVTLTVTDASGNKSTAEATVTVEDNVAPVAKTKNFMVTLDATGKATIAAADVNNGSSDNCGIETLVLSKTAFDCSNLGSNTVTLTATDKSGNSHTATAIVTVVDETLPVASAKNITVQLDASGSVTIAASDVNNGSSDACGIKSMTLNKTTFDCANVGDNTVTLTVTDNNGNVATATAIVTVEDKIVPVAKAQNLTIELDANGVATVTAAAVDNGSTDACGPVTLALSKTTFGCANIGANTVTLTVTDKNGNKSTAEATITVVDKLATVARAKDITVQLDATGKATIVVADVNNGSSDNCGIETLTLDITAFNCSNVGENIVTLTATDISGNSHTATAKVTVVDTTAPVVITQNITVQLDATGKAIISESDIDKGSTDACGIKSMSLDITSFSCANIGDNEVTLTVTDNNGNVAYKTATVTVEDKTAPTALTRNITIKLDATGKATIAAADVDNGSSDVCGTITLTIDKTAFDCSNIGDNTVKLTVTDASGNTASEKAIVTIVDDLTPIVATRNITLQLDAAGKASITVADIDNGSTDACGIASMALDQTEFSCGGTTTVILTVTDVNGNVATGTATVTVEDKVAPVAKAKDITVELDATGKATIVASDVDNGSEDNCGIASITLTKTAFDCSNVGANTVLLTVTDNSGNTHTAQAIVTVVDNINPTITAPAAVVVDVDAGKNTASNVALGTPVTADNCSVATVTNDAPATFPTGTTTVTWTVTDANGNTATATQIVTVRRDVVSVATPATVNVPIRTTFANVPLPTTVTVTYSDNSTAQIGVTWSQGNYNGLVAGTYTIAGQLVLAAGTTNTGNKSASITVVVEPNKVPTALAFSATTFAPNIKADEAIGTLSTTDPDDTQFVYSLVSGSGDADNSLFEIIGDKVYLKSNNGLSGKTVFSFRVRSTDPYQNTIEKAFTLTKGNYGVAADKLKIVNAFSPNGDGINDTWSIPELRFYNNVEVEVFDRAGVRLFHSTNPEMTWDGRSANGQILQGAFFYIVQIKDINLVKKGVVTILKK